MTLQEAAEKIGIAKKTLDDYMMVIKQAKALNFDFQNNRDQRFGMVRSFVKKAKQDKNQRFIRQDDFSNELDYNN
eukprot:CAMPEP_0114588146 /NCGR_PEP_ID=MMETSP0125-20121206/10922_1 /TAXON_ID=485358 ORGANISM="Aristerostoma sp., Strain ATCC 50986" /NCGR_SAMPLE_ID=MMETSP0125 /ASSEMBLY_ACC=CAM_ASM_000245 /LENGTH=74 /DNA_ID=CAMNT_0001784397 /DNA_START=855 /DNA_END=1079 /DNA_ORIENTATION=+